MMRNRLTISLFALCVCFASAALAQMPPGAGDIVPGGSDVDQPSSKPQVPVDPEAQAEDFRLHGQCDKAIPIFRRLARKGAGYELAQYNLGLCLFDTSNGDKDARSAAGTQCEGAEWILRAANNGLPNAQLRVVSLYLDGKGVASDPVEAGKWALIYHDNSMRHVLSLPDIPPDLQSRLDGVLTETSWADAQARADSWNPAIQDWDSGHSTAGVDLTRCSATAKTDTPH